MSTAFSLPEKGEDVALLRESVAESQEHGQGGRKGSRADLCLGSRKGYVQAEERAEGIPEDAVAPAG